LRYRGRGREREWTHGCRILGFKREGDEAFHITCIFSFYLGVLVDQSFWKNGLITGSMDHGSKEGSWSGLIDVLMSSLS
jgi:hypothetical protein